ncbi:Integral membrane protein SED5 [Elasticomyces elasticus]|nr:Integral membrane protein SED5 [Elasticomyces elasticus]
MSTHASIQDRTPEFRSILSQAHKSLARNRQQQKQPLLPAQKVPTRKERTEFSRSAAGISRGIASTVGKLERLGALAKRKTLFDDRPVEIAELTFVIKQDLAGLNQQIGALQSLQRRTGIGSKQNDVVGSKEEGEHNKNVVLLLQNSLAGVGANFKDVLEQSQQQQNGQLLDPGRTDSPLYSTPSRGRSPKPGQNSAVQQDLLSLDPSNSSPLYSSDGPASQQQLQLMEEGASSNSSYITQRSDAIQSIESTIAELGGIFGQLAQMVSEQSEQIQRIDANTDDVVDNVEGAQRELMKYWSRVQGNRWLVAKMMGVLMIFFLLWVLIAG